MFFYLTKNHNKIDRYVKMKFEFLKDFKNYKKGDRIELKQNFWSFYYEQKGIIIKYQPKPTKNKGKRGKKDESI